VSRGYVRSSQIAGGWKVNSPLCCHLNSHIVPERADTVIKHLQNSLNRRCLSNRTSCTNQLPPASSNRPELDLCTFLETDTSSLPGSHLSKKVSCTYFVLVTWLVQVASGFFLFSPKDMSMGSLTTWHQVLDRISSRLTPLSFVSILNTKNRQVYR
jgi:hypothetical protein